MNNQEMQTSYNPDVITHIINMVIMAVPVKQVCDAMMISERQLAEIQDSLQYREAYAQELQIRSAREASKSAGWDDIEALALSQVKQAMETYGDPDFALRAAQIANKASRSHKHADGAPINAVGAAGVATLKLSTRVIRKLAGVNGEITQEAEITAERKQINIFPPGDLENFMSAIDGESEELLTEKDAQDLVFA